MTSKSQELLKFYLRFWNKKAEIDKVLQQGALDIPESLAHCCRLLFKKTAKTHVASMAGAPTISIYVRKEYQLLCSHLQSCDQPGVVVLGSPGIGKSVFNIYALARHLPEAIYVTSTSDPAEQTIPFIFNAAGVRPLDLYEKDLGLFGFPPHTWCLYDSTPRGVQPNSKLVEETFLVFTVAPDTSRYDGVLKQGFDTWYMNPWDFDEITAFLKTQHQVADKDVYNVTGGYIRDYRLAQRNQDSQDIVKTNIDAAVVTVASAARHPRIVNQQPSPLGIGHQLFALY
ncbi:hypothetical protein VKT23_016317 [Stygiomarasmius scandens]|uniref:Uncharacterized protein n=1 Tax=Marasmiellus scandens TaxID=2682957 RepID=A0ABR1IZK5_9AGAR